MCIVLLTTAHPKYALVIIDNRDEYILRPTSRPHWWTAHPESHDPPQSTANGNNGSGKINGTKPPPPEIHILSSRDLQREERGTWMGITKGGNFAVLTNYRETNTHDAAHPVRGVRSRGGMVTAWLRADPKESTAEFVHRLLHDGSVKGVGGFSLVCGKLRKVPGERRIEPLAIISNRCDHPDEVPWICGGRDDAVGLSNAIFLTPAEEKRQSDLLWPKIRDGREMLRRVVSEAKTEQELIPALFKILDDDRFPPNHTMDLEEGMNYLKDSIFIPAFGNEEKQREMREARRRGAANGRNGKDRVAGSPPAPGDQTNGFQTGLYGTQRQTIILVDWDGNVTYVERALFDKYGNPIPRGQADEVFRFKIDGWENRALSANL
ncbi:hypothetical protein VTJ04DRAFT_6876 [Mycothermus thermophilus]|uniref:uncharacterized protein n=1 Tax=Humicola insolens TaxID=85995 RepID=UPI0037438153